jgi:hypothetical protein
VVVVVVLLVEFWFTNSDDLEFVWEICGVVTIATTSAKLSLVRDARELPRLTFGLHQIDHPKFLRSIGYQV